MFILGEPIMNLIIKISRSTKNNFQMFLLNISRDTGIRPGVFGGEVSPEKGIYGSVIFF